MPLVVADTGPLYYLVPTGDIELLPKLFERVLVPQVVRDELANAEAPQAVRDWIARAPGWLDARPAHPGADDVAVAKLDEGERAAIALALAVKAELGIMDDREGVGIARGCGLAVTGTLGVLDPAARRGQIDLAAAFERLKTTTFYYRQGTARGVAGAARHRARLRAIMRHAISGSERNSAAAAGCGAAPTSAPARLSPSASIGSRSAVRQRCAVP